MSNTFIHPELLLRVQSDLLSAQTDKLDDFNFEKAKKNGEDVANEVLKALFANSQEYGNIESHFNTDRLNSSKFSDFRNKIISVHFQKKVII